VPVARACIPPVQPLLVEIRGLRQRRKQNDAFVGEQVAHFRGGACGERRVLHHFETGDDIKSARWTLAESRKRVVGRRAESLRDEMARKHAVAAPEIEDCDGIACGAKRIGDGGRVAERASGGVIGIDMDVTGIVDVREESFGRPIVELVGEGESACGAAAIVDRASGKRQALSLCLDAALVKVDDAEKRAGAAADFAVVGFGIDDHEHAADSVVQRPIWG